MEYRIVRAETPSALELEVNGLLAEGWTLVGGMVIEPQAFGSRLYQTLTRSAEKPATAKKTAAAKAVADV